MLTLGDLKIATLKLVLNDGDDLVVDNIPEYESNDNYSNVLMNFIDFFNMCLGRLMVTKTLPFKTFEINDSSAFLSKNDNFTRYNLAELQNDLFEVEDISYEYTTETNQIDVVHANYSIYGNVLLIKTLQGGKYFVTYSPRPKLAMKFDSDSTEISHYGLFDELALIIPYFIKSEVLMEEDKAKALISKNLFENYLSGFIRSQRKSIQNCVESVGWY